MKRPFPIRLLWCRILDLPFELRDWFRWKIARFMDRHTDTCWADLATWAVYAGDYPFGDILHMRGRAGTCERRGEHPYCEKCYRIHEPHGGMGEEDVT